MREAYSYRQDAAVPRFADDRPIIIFDGHCALCSGWARFVLRHDRRGRYRLLPAQTALGRALYVHYGLDPEDYETNILLTDGIVLPLELRDRLYQSVARNRLRLFGRRRVCYLGEPGQEDRFLT